MIDNKEFFSSSHWVSEYRRKRGWAHAPVFRKRFEVAGFKKAVCAISGLGFFELRINGRKVGDDLMVPSTTRYDVRTEYMVYDVAEYLKEGENIAEVILGNGTFNQITSDIFRSEHAIWKSDPKFIIDLQLDDKSVLVSDRSWLVAHGEIISNSHRTGEKFDARLRLADWQSGVDPDPEVWHEVFLINSPGGELTRAEQPPCRITEELQAVDSWQLEDGSVMFDFGKNIAGNCQIKVSGPAGSSVKLVHGEKLNEKRELDNQHIAMYTFDQEWFQTDIYTLDDAAEQVWSPSFGYHGFQYVKVVCENGSELKSITARVIRSSFDVIGKCKTSDAVLDRLVEMSLTSYESNFVNIPTDCPHREKMGWTGDAQLAAELALWHYAAGGSYSSWLHTMRDCQRLDGQVPGMVPYSDHWQFGPVWDGALIILPYQIWRFTGDEKIVKDNYQAAKKLMAYFAGLADNDALDIGPGDWCHVEQERAIRGSVDSTAYYYLCAKNMAVMAPVAGFAEDAAGWNGLAERIRKAFQREFCPGDGHCYGDQSTALALALTFDLVPENERAIMAKRLNDRMKEVDYCADFGITGAKAVPRALAENGYFDTALKVLTQKKFPGWGWWLEQGATSFWETWKGDQSRNHIMFGDVAAWVWEFAGGLHPEISGVGFKHFTVQPPVTELLDNFECEHQTPHGLLKWAWQKNGSSFNGTLTVPENCTAKCILPGRDAIVLNGGTHQLEW